LKCCLSKVSGVFVTMRAVAQGAHSVRGRFGFCSNSRRARRSPFFAGQPPRSLDRCPLSSVVKKEPSIEFRPGPAGARCRFRASFCWRAFWWRALGGPTEYGLFSVAISAGRWFTCCDGVIGGAAFGPHGGPIRFSALHARRDEPHATLRGDGAGTSNWIATAVCFLGALIWRKGTFFRLLCR